MIELWELGEQRELGGMAMVKVEDLYKAMYYSLSEIGKVYLQNRPSAVKDSTDEFLVAELPSGISEVEQGQDGEYGLYWTTAQVLVFVKDDISASNPNQLSVTRLSELCAEVMGKFPIKDKARGVTLSKPRLTLNAASDERGFHYSVIQSKLTINSPAQPSQGEEGN